MPDGDADAARSAYEGLDDAAKAGVRRILLRMIELDDGLRPRWRRVPASGVDACALDVLREAGIVAFHGDEVAVRDPSLLERWPELAGWVAGQRSEVLIREQIAVAAGAWVAAGRCDALLWRGPRLALARRFAAGHWGDVELATASSGPFLAAALERERAAGGRALRRRRRILAGACTLLLVAGGIWHAGSSSAGGATAQSAAARSRELIADAESATATPRIAEQLALAAYRYDPSPEAANLLYNLLDRPAYTTLARTGSAILRLTAARDAPVVAASSQSTGVRIWNFADRAAPVLEATLGDVPGAALALSPDGGLLAAACRPSRLCLWSLADPKDPKIAGVLAAPRSKRPAVGVTGVAYSTDGAYVAAAAENGSTYVWSVAKPDHPRLIATLPNPDPGSDTLAAVAFSPRADLLAETMQGGSTRLWSLGDGARPALVAVIAAGYQGLAFSRDGSLLTAVGDQRVGLWSMADPAHPAPIAVQDACTTGGSGSVLDRHAVAFSPGGDQIAYSGTDTTDGLSTLCVVDLTATGPGYSVPSATSIPADVGSLAAVYSSTGALLTGQQDGSVRQWRTPLPQIGGIALPEHGNSFDVSSDGRLLAGIQAGGPNLRSELGVELWDLAGSAGPVLDATLPVAAGTVSFLKPAILMTATQSGLLQLWDVSDPSHPVAGAMLGDALIPAGDGWSYSGEVNNNRAGTLVSVLGSDDRLHLWRVADAGRARQLSSIPVPEARSQYVGAGLVSSSTGLVITAAGIQWWDIADPAHPVRGTFTALPRVDMGQLTGAHGLAVAGPPSGALKLYAVGAGTVSSAVPLPAGGSAQATMSEDGRLTAVTDGGGASVTLWATADPLAPRRTATVNVPDPYRYESVTFDESDTLMSVWNDQNGSVRIWNVRDPRAPALEETFTPPEQARDLSESLITAAMEFGPSGSMFIQSDESLYLLDATASGFADSLCAEVGPITASQWRLYAPGVPYLDPCPSHAA